MKINFAKTTDGFIPAIIQDAETKVNLMLGYMNQEAYQKTIATNKVTFYSRSKKRLWTKGEESGNFLMLKSIKIDCDADALLVEVHPSGPVCHTGTDTCWTVSNKTHYGFLSELENIITQRKQTEVQDSYITSLFKKGFNKIAQKVGEEAVEMIIEAKDNDKDLFLNESADLLFHYLILLQAKGYKLNDIVEILKLRHSIPASRVGRSN